MSFKTIDPQRDTIGWHLAFAAGIKGNPRLVVKDPPQKQPAKAELEAMAAMEGERSIAVFQAEINARCPSAGNNPILLLTAAFPQLSIHGGKGVSLTFSRNIDACRYNKRLKARYSSNQLIALAAARTLASLLDYEPARFHSLFANCCRVAKTHLPEMMAQSQYRQLI